MLSKKQTASTKGQPSSLRRGIMSVMVDQLAPAAEKLDFQFLEKLAAGRKFNRENNIQYDFFPSTLNYAICCA